MYMLIGVLWTIYGHELFDCTDDGVTKEYLLENETSRSNLAWLVTPGVFALGIIYLIYKCCKDGICNCRRLRERAGIPLVYFKKKTVNTCWENSK